MIATYRNRGILQLGAALALTTALIFLLTRKRGLHVDDGWAVLGIFLYLGVWAAWLAASYNFFKAKGYSPHTSGGIFLFMILFSLCVPICTNHLSRLHHFWTGGQDASSKNATLTRTASVVVPGRIMAASR